MTKTVLDFFLMIWIKGEAMNICTYADRLEIENGQLVRILKALPKAKKMKGRELDIYKEYENGVTLCRNLYYNACGGYRVAFPNEKTSLYREGYCSFIQELEEYGKCSIPAFKYYSRDPNEEEKELIISLYPEFKYVLKKWNGSIYKTLELLSLWKEHKEIEFMLAAGFEVMAFNKAFWRLSQAKRKEIILFLKQHPEYKSKQLASVQTVIKYNLTTEELSEYESFCSLCGKVKYDVFRYLEKAGMNDWSGVQLYRDYWNLLKQTNHSKTQDYWRFPKNIAQKHNELLREVEQINILKDIEKMKPKQEQYFKAVKKLLKYKMEIDGYCVYVPETVEDISYQARVLHQCLISCDYVSQVINKKCVLVFIKKNGCPIATAQLLSGNKIGQFYANELDRNNCLPSDEVRAVMNKWIELKAAA